ncbi:MAG: ABC transporter permease [Alphaproteobacteria bacterium]|nr:ABC transporter permease [Alphaproteobacteria bacterium]
MSAALAARRAPDGTLELALAGRWTLASLAAVDAALREAAAAAPARARIDLAAVEAMDAAGAWLVWRTEQALGAAGTAVVTAPGGHAHILSVVRQSGSAPCEERPPERSLAAFFARVGAGTIAAAQHGRELLGFFGLCCVYLARTAARPGRLRLGAVTTTLERAGLDALPIVGLLCFLIGVVLAYQSVDQLARFGAEQLTVNVLGISVLREFGVLITAVIVAGRSASAFCAQIGSMVANQEVDAMRALGLDPIDVLVVPRVVALVVAMPLLTFYADMAALLGGGMFVVLRLEMTPGQFIEILADAIRTNTFVVGLVKAPVFGGTIALIGCYEGLRVFGGADAVGRQTTQAVVASIFFVIVLDAAFSIIFSILRV